ncbi:S16 family serine protease, partial [Klebsiella pneumoniae]|uniref:S16 family serine protease n=1 Tax=Klebsiella pneumoniae TaxID=573 RepID=UPI00396901E0
MCKQRGKEEEAMSCELPLTGQVLPTGGAREKVIAARRQKIFELILPEANRGHFEELPDYLREGLSGNFYWRYLHMAMLR